MLDRTARQGGGPTEEIGKQHRRAVPAALEPPFFRGRSFVAKHKSSSVEKITKAGH